eukprot:PITA_10861
MVEVYASIIKNNVWEVVPRPEGKSIVTSRWLYKIKHVADGSIEKFKARFVARGFSQIEGVDYDETFAPGTIDYGMDYRRGDGVKLAGYTYSDWAGCASDMKSTSECCFGLGSAVVSWFSRKKNSVALSSSEAEYMAPSQASCEAIWLRKLLYGLFDQELRKTVIHCDNQSCIKLTENPVLHDRSKHIDIIYHFIRDYVQKEAEKLEYISTDEQVADVLTKSLPRDKHVHFRDKMGVVKNTFLGKREC